ncbi:glutathione S-transferase N-terminal domain-containing protein [Parvibium lacunae]|uniref:Glutathione S-transferase n=1 Tax=Parvibium lacunae TaxID=1888893 RepID=A0A368KZN2_9BURK|nr:glutathione S-transferase N-terminal domain-containing protein [Parvibium lacunae]RCS56770.1 glutathione S-transferase [Parvibium lacunae]
MKLLGSLTSPYARKVRVVLAEKKIDYQLELQDVWAPDTTIHAANPLGKVPTLIMEDGGAVFDSRVIVEYLDSISPVHRLIPQNGRERVEVRCWEALADGLLDAAILMRLEETQRAPEQRSAAWVERQMHKVTLSLNAMAQGLGEKPWCNGHAYTLADIAVGCALNWLSFRFPQIDWRGAHPNLASLVDKLNQRQTFIDTVPVA